MLQSRSVSLVVAVAWIFLLVLAVVAAENKVDSSSSQRPPNFVLFLGDNLGYADIGYLAAKEEQNGKNNHDNDTNKTSRTPHIDQLAATGLHLEHWNSVAHLCSASRSALLTGRYPIRDGVYPGVFHNNAAAGLSPNTPTIASLLKQYGNYVTSAVGKWHLGHRPEFLPTRLGFDEWLGVPYHMSGGSLDGHVCYNDNNNDNSGTSHMMWLPLYHNETIVQQPVQLAQLADRYATRARTFIQQAAAVDDQPFFLYVPFSHVHQLCAPRNLPQQEYCQWTADPTKTTFDDAVQEMDWIVGQVMQAITTSENKNVASNTLVLFTADNGPWVAEQSCSGKKGKFQGTWLMDHVPKDCTACPHDYIPSPTLDNPHRCILPDSNPVLLELTGVPCGYDSGLGSMWEGNLRMPAFAWFPGRIAPSRVTSQTVSSLDVLPTFLSLAGVESFSQDQEEKNSFVIDGVDISSVLFQQNFERNEMAVQDTTNHHDEDERIIYFWRDGFADGPLKPPYGRMDVVAIKVGYRKAWFWTKSGHYNDDPHVYHDPPLVFDIDKDPAESQPIAVSAEFIKRVQKLRRDHMEQVEWGPPLTLEQDDAYLPCADPQKNCRTDDPSEAMTITSAQELKRRYVEKVSGEHASSFLIPVANALQRPHGANFVARGGGIGNLGRFKKEPSAQVKPNIWTAIGALWYKIPHPARYFVSGNFGNVCLYFLERAVRISLESNLEHPPKHLDSISYFTAYLMHIILQHAAHALLVYGLDSVSTRQKYWSTLFGTYQAYFVSAFGSTFVNSYLIQIGVNREVAFVTTLWFFACLNYLWIGYVVKKAKEKAEAEAQPKKRFVSKRQQAKMAATRRG